MIFKDLLKHFQIEESFPDYLLSQTFNEVFRDGNMVRKNGNYKISIRTRQNVTHQMIISPDDAYPVTILSELPNGSQNGMKFGQSESDVKYISGL